MLPSLASALALLAVSGCCANPFHVRLAPPRERAWSGVEVLPVGVETPTPLSRRVAAEAAENARRLTEYLSRRVPVGHSSPPSLRLHARFVEYRHQFIFRPGGSTVLATFYDEAGQVVAEGEVQSNDPSLGRGSYYSCTTVEELGDTIVGFIQKSLLAR